MILSGHGRESRIKRSPGVHERARPEASRQDDRQTAPRAGAPGGSKALGKGKSKKEEVRECYGKEEIFSYIADHW